VPAVPIPGIATGREAQYAKRVKELEDELRLMRVENEKNVSSLFSPLNIDRCYKRKRNCLEIDDRQIPRALGKVEGLCET